MSAKGDRKRRRALDAYSRLQRAAALAASQVDEAVQPFGLSASQFGVLDTIATRGAVHQQELAEALDRSKAQMTAIIDALESRGLVRRERHAIDRRFITVHLTPEGRVVLADATPARTAAIVALMSALTGQQRGRLSRLCRRLLRVLDPYEDVVADVVPGSDALDTVHGSANPLLGAPPNPSNSTASTDAGTALPTDTRAHAGS
jgi:MarR family 2-MHQ and catechol resistance regulon transcriptional repressor